MAEAIDRFITTDTAKKNGIFSRTDFISAVVRMWFSNYDKDFRIFVAGREVTHFELKDDKH